MFVDSMMDLVKKGIVTGKIVAGFGLGSNELYNFMADARVELRPDRIINDPTEIAKIDNLISINVTLMVDLTGQACSESLGFSSIALPAGKSDFMTGRRAVEGRKRISLPAFNHPDERWDQIHDHGCASSGGSGDHTEVRCHVHGHGIWDCGSLPETDPGPGQCNDCHCPS